MKDTAVTNSTPTSGLTYADLIQIVELLRQSEQFSSFKLKTPELELEVLREGAAMPSTAGQHSLAAAHLPAASAAVAAVAAPAARSDADGAAAPSHSTASEGSPINAPESASAPAPAAAAAASDRTLRAVTSPMVGTFYAAPEPGAAPFVQPGQSVRTGDVLCIIEVMKLMNTLRAEFDGIVREIAVRDAQAVEYGELLMQVEPA
jgi:acetyl-CoA carboxylase biotin carboxyl carrier protein